MRRVLMASTGFLAIAWSGSALAETVIDTKVTTPVRTSTVKSGARDDVRIASTGTVNPTSGPAVTIDSNNTVTNAGTIQVTDANDATGILAQAGVTGAITNSGKITIDETYTPTDTDKDGDLDGPFAQGSGRAAIRTLGAFTGNIAHSGEILVEGNDSAGIRLGGTLTGNFTHDGKTVVIGDHSVGVRLADVTGNITLGGSIGASGQGAVGARFDGDVTGALVVQGGIAATGYRNVVAPADLSKLDADDLLQGGSALLIGGNVSGGVVLSGATDKTGDVISYGGAPAFQIGSATRSVTIGPVAGTTPGPGLQINGRVTGAGVYSGIAATGLNVGGLGGTVTIANGIAVGGTVQATAVGANATALRIGAGATTPEIAITGTIAATGGTAAVSTGVLIDSGGSVPKVRNSGIIRVVAGKDGTGIAIQDRSGGLTLIENNGVISATGAEGGRNIAIDLSANTSGATVRQIAQTSGTTAPSIAGAIRFGAGNDVLDIAAGTVNGEVTFGAGRDTLALSGSGRFDGTADFGGEADLITIKEKGVFAGKLANAGNVAVTIASGGGTFAANGATTIGSLTLGDQSVLSVALDKANPAASLIQVNGATTIGTGSQLALRVTSGADITGRYVVLRSGTLTGLSNLTLSAEAVPFLFKGTLSASQPNEIAVEVARKAKTELGFNAAQFNAFDAIDTALNGDAKVAAAVRGIYKGEEFRGAVDQLLPNYAGGVFESVTLGARSAAGQMLEPSGSFSEEGEWGFWLTPVGYDASKDTHNTIRYDVNGWGMSTGVEHKTGAGNFGLALALLKGRASEGIATNRVDHRQYELAATWRGHWGGLQAHARVGAARVSFDSLRYFDGVIGSEKVHRETRADWNGMLYSAGASVGYEHMIGGISVRPNVILEYYRLNEDAYRESGGGAAVDLIVDKRKSDELAVTAGLAAGVNVGGDNRYEQWSRIEIEGGRRQRIAGDLGSTTASFAGGTPFTIDPEDRGSGWVGKIRAITGTTEVRLSAEGGAEQRLGNIALSARAALQFAF